jgi:hypothetical protein
LGLTWNINVRRLAFAGFALLATGCATLGADSPSSEKTRAVTERSRARGQAIINRDFDAAYDYLSPASRATVTRARFKAAASRLDYRRADIKGATCEKTRCEVEMDLTYDTAMMKGIRTPLKEAWVIDQGNVWFVWPM